MIGGDRLGINGEVEGKMKNTNIGEVPPFFGGEHFGGFGSAQTHRRVDRRATVVTEATKASFLDSASSPQLRNVRLHACSFCVGTANPHLTFFPIGPRSFFSAVVSDFCTKERKGSFIVRLDIF